MKLFQKIPQIVHKPLPYEEIMLKILLILGLLLFVWSIFEVDEE